MPNFEDLPRNKVSKGGENAPKMAVWQLILYIRIKGEKHKKS